MLGYLKQSTASQTRIVGPFVDDTDFKTLETGLTIANTDVKLSKNGGTSANKNSGGGTHIANGNYALTFDATDTATVGELHASISVAGALVVVAKFIVLEEAIYDALFGASAAAFNASAQVAIDMAQSLPGSPTADTTGDALKQATKEEAPKKNVALSDIPFYMVDDTDGKTPETGLTVTAEVSKDGGAFASAGGSVTEISDGVYHFDAAQADMNADVVVLKFTASGARAAIVAFSTVE